MEKRETLTIGKTAGTKCLSLGFVVVVCDATFARGHKVDHACYSQDWFTLLFEFA